MAQVTLRNVPALRRTNSSEIITHVYTRSEENENVMKAYFSHNVCKRAFDSSRMWHLAAGYRRRRA